MLLTRAQVLQVCAVAGIPTAVESLLAPDEISGDVFSTVTPEFLAGAWKGFVDNLPDSLIEMRPVGSSGLTVKVPRYLLNGFCCRGVSLAVYASAMLGFAIDAAHASEPLDHDALAFGFFHYTAQPRAGNLFRSGRHEQLWFIDSGGVFRTFEPGDDQTEPLTLAELSSITLLFAQ